MRIIILSGAISAPTKREPTLSAGIDYRLSTQRLSFAGTNSLTPIDDHDRRGIVIDIYTGQDPPNHAKYVTSLLFFLILYTS